VRRPNPARSEAPTASDLIGTAVQIGGDGKAWVRSVLVDSNARAILLRLQLETNQTVAYVPVAALEIEGDRVQAEPHVLLGGVEAAYYVGRGLEWVVEREVLHSEVPGIVAT